MAAIFQKKTPSPNKIRSPSSHQTSPSRFKFLISGKTKEKSQVTAFEFLITSSNYLFFKTNSYSQNVKYLYLIANFC